MENKDTVTIVNSNTVDTTVKEESPEFKTADIDGKTWMAENLNVSVFRNGDSIPQAKSISEWVDAGKQEKPIWCYYEDKSENGIKYGKLYNWYAVNDSRGLAPAGWRIPSADDFKSLNKLLGGEKKAAIALKSNTGWEPGAEGNNASGFAGLPAGTRNFNGSFANGGTHGYWWSISDQKDFNAWHLSVNNKNSIAKVYTSLKSAGFSVRCIKE